MRFKLAACLMMLAAPALADGGECSGWADLAPATKITLAKVAAPKLNFLKNASEGPGCPSTSASCLRKGFMVEGDMLIISGVENGLACGQFVNSRGLESTGWVPLSSLAEVPSGAVAAKDWTGNWNGGPEQSIKITAAPAPTMLNLHGDATFGAQDPARVKRGAVNIGEFDAQVKVEGNATSFTIGDGGKTLTYDKGDEFACKIRMRRLGPFLMVEDNRQCGGNNVSFTGDYRKP